MPWQSFAAELKTTGAWDEVGLPFRDFRPEYVTVRARLDPAKLQRLAIVAIGKAFSADVAAPHIEFYR